MVCELDHIFVCTAPGAPESDRLRAFGLTEGAANTHPGQGTACRRFFFANAYLELLWVCDPAEARSQVSRPTKLWERWVGREDDSCPFGLGFRPKPPGGAPPPFSTWDYHPSFLPPSVSFQVGTNSNLLTEPMLFLLAFARRPDSYSPEKRQPLQHPIGFHELTRVELVSPHLENLSPALHAIAGANLVRLRRGAAFLMEMGFDGEAQGHAHDLRPALPLVFRW
jgi:hypothetical protein